MAAPGRRAPSNGAIRPVEDHRTVHESDGANTWIFVGPWMARGWLLPVEGLAGVVCWRKTLLPRPRPLLLPLLLPLPVSVQLLLPLLLPLPLPLPLPWAVEDVRVVQIEVRMVFVPQVRCADDRRFSFK